MRFVFRSAIVFLSSVASVCSVCRAADGPSTRKVTDPKSVQSEARGIQPPLPVDALLKTVRIGFVAHSSDGKRLVYTSNASGRPNLWTMNIDGTDARQMVKNNDRQGGGIFTPDAQNIVYSQDRGGNESFDVWLVPSAGGEPRNLTNTDDVSETVQKFSPDGRSLLIGLKQTTAPQTNLAVMSWPDGSVRQITHEKDPRASWQMGAWSPDGKTLFATRTSGVADSDIYSIDTTTGAATKLLDHTGVQELNVNDASPDGRRLLITSNAKGGYDNVALFDLHTRTLKWLTDTRWAASGVAFSPDGEDVVFTLNADGRVSTEFIHLKTSKLSDRGVPPGINLPSAPSSPFLSDGSILLMHEDSSRPQELCRLMRDNTLQQITHNAGEAIQAADLPKSQLITYKSFDGRLISAFVWIPHNIERDGKAPVVVTPHGGPTSQTTDVFNGRNELLASRGFIVISPNYRGSTGYGAEFQQANVKDLGGADLKDVIAGVDFLKATGFADPSRVGIWGGSYGGFLTLMAVGKYPQVFSAAVDEYGILNWLTMLEHEDPALQEIEKSLLGDPIRERAIYEASSPLKYIQNETAPLLVLQGDNDVRVPKEQAEQVVRILKDAGRNVDAIYYPDEGHGFVKREHQRDELNRAVTWLERYLKRV